MSVWIWLCPLIILALPFAFFVGKRYFARREMARAAEEHCLVCESRDVRSKGADDYECLECGFESTWKNDDQIAPLLHQLRDLREAEHNFEEAAENMKYAKWWSTFDVFTGSGSGKREYMRKAGKAQLRGLSMVEDVIDEYPELMEMPVAGDTVEATPLADAVVDSLGTDLKVDRQIAQSREKVEKFLWTVRRINDNVVKRIEDAIDDKSSEFTG